MVNEDLDKVGYLVKWSRWSWNTTTNNDAIFALQTHAKSTLYDSTPNIHVTHDFQAAESFIYK